ncbi:hypothetical protein ACQQ2N_02895 [Dokdonella sp. MW10]|uniref:hypothetical protein n=1 Tax=Dokdonella sp. MW10 TaxID=2992926 RepID=UPI003F7CF785
MKNRAARIGNTATIVILLAFLMVTKIPSILFFLDRELWMTASESDDAFLHDLKVDLLLLRGADPQRVYGDARGYSAIDMASIAGKKRFLDRIYCSATQQRKDSILATVASRNSGLAIYTSSS